MRIAIHGKEFNRETVPFIQELFSVLSKHQVDLRVSARFSKYLTKSTFKAFKYKVFEPNNTLKGIDYFISVGGDGTLLESVTYIGKSDIPVLGINTGRLGFLATISKEDIVDAIEKLIEGKYTLDSRSLLQLHSNKKIFGKQNFALNDFSIVKTDSSSMITIHTYMNGAFLNSYWADGIILATPTGSTGYSLSCGGPLIFPQAQNFVMTPVSPHNLTVRPIILPDSAEITFQVEGRSKKFLVALDSRVASVDASVKLTVKKAAFQIRLIQIEGHHYFKTLRQKLNWGLDVRN
jgi:NAD+ kinase